MNSAEKLQVQGRLIEPGKIVDFSGYPEIYFLPDEQETLAAAERTLRRINEIWGTEQNNQPMTSDGFKTILYNAQKDEFISVDVSPILGPIDHTQNLFRAVKIFISNGMSLESNLDFIPTVEKDTYILALPSYQFVTMDYNIQQYPEHTRAYVASDEDPAILLRASLADSVDTVLDLAKGIKVNPYEILYGEMSDSQLIKAYIGDEGIVDQESKRVILVDKGSGPQYGSRRASELDYETTLKQARAYLAKEVWGIGFSDMVNRLKKSWNDFDSVG